MSANITEVGTTQPTGLPSGYSYTTRAIDVTVQLGKGSFGTSGANTVKLSGLRVAATIRKYGSPGFDTASVRMYGLPSSLMNQVSTLGAPIPMERDNNVLIEAGDPINGMSLVFQGTIQNAWQEFDGAPDTYLTIDSVSGAFAAMQPTPAISFPGSADVATIISGIATRIGRTFNNAGVQVTLSNPYFAGTPLEQAQKCARAANVEFYDDGSTFYIWPKTGNRSGAVPLISPQSGLVGYPKYTSQGMQFRCLYNPSILFGGLIKMQSSIQPACGTWYVNELTYNLAAQIPNGPWFCEVGCVRQVGAPAP